MTYLTQFGLFISLLFKPFFDGVNSDNALLTERESCIPKIASYYFGVEKLPVHQQVTTLKNLQMDGIMVDVAQRNLDSLEIYYQTREVRSGAFHLYDIWTTVSVNDSVKLKQQLKAVEFIYSQIQYKETQLQVIFNGISSHENITKVIEQVAAVADRFNKLLIIYPHYGNSIATTEQALAFIKSVKKANIYLAFHLCHELRAGNGHRINEVIKNVAPYIKSASISGASESERNNVSLPNWFFGIKPLFMGDYDLSPCFISLKLAGYNGPITLHTWGIDRNFGLKPEDNLPQSRKVLINLAKTNCTK